MVKNILTIILFSLIFTQEPDQIITQKDFQTFGIKRLSDMVSLIHQFQSSSIDGFDYHQSSFSGRSDGFVVFINNKHINIDIFGSKNLEYLPITLREIDFLEIYTDHVTINGIYASDGVLHFHTKKIEKKLSLQIRSAIYNEIGDPGPYRYTKKDSPNIDHNGPDLTTGLSYKLDSINFKLSHTFIEHRPLDGRLQKEYSRVKLIDDWPDILFNKTQLSMNWHNHSSSFELNFSNIKQHHFQFFPALGNELPLFQNIKSVILNGKANFSKVKLVFVASLNKTETNQDQNSYNLDLNHERISSYIQLNSILEMKQDRIGFSVFVKSYSIKSNIVQNSDQTFVDFTSSYQHQYSNSRFNSSISINDTKYLGGYLQINFKNLSFSSGFKEESIINDSHFEYLLKTSQSSFYRFNREDDKKNSFLYLTMSGKNTFINKIQAKMKLF